MIQARMSSTRLPGKVLMDISGKSMLARVIGRLKRARHIDQIGVVSSQNPADEKIGFECQKLKIPFFRGSEEDVLNRYHEAAKAWGAKNVVRITSDCPLIDPEIVDQVITRFLNEKADYASNVLSRTFPRGLDTEVFSFETLQKTDLQAKTQRYKEHVTLFMVENPKEFNLVSVTTEPNYSDYRWTVDTTEDLNFIRTVYSRFNESNFFSWKDVLTLLKREPHLCDLNSHIKQKSTSAS